LSRLSENEFFSILPRAPQRLRRTGKTPAVVQVSREHDRVLVADLLKDLPGAGRIEIQQLFHELRHPFASK